jgi:hypothetical protein
LALVEVERPMDHPVLVPGLVGGGGDEGNYQRPAHRAQSIRLRARKGGLRGAVV